jgi:hypothetical protein
MQCPRTDQQLFARANDGAVIDPALAAVLLDQHRGPQVLRADARCAVDVGEAHADAASSQRQRRLELGRRDGQALRVVQAPQCHGAVANYRARQRANPDNDVVVTQHRHDRSPAAELLVCALQSELQRHIRLAERGRRSRRRLRAASAASGRRSTRPRDRCGHRSAGRRRRARARRRRACRRRRRPCFVVVVGHPGSASVIRRRWRGRWCSRRSRGAHSQRSRGGRLASSAGAVARRVVLARPLRRRRGRRCSERPRRGWVENHQLEPPPRVALGEETADRRRGRKALHHQHPRAVGRVRRRAHAQRCARRNLRQGMRAP